MNMKPFSYDSSIPSSMHKSLWLQLIGATLILVIAGPLVGTFFDTLAGKGAAVLACFAIGTAVMLRRLFRRGWDLVLSSSITWTNKRRFGVAWRTTASFLIGNWVMQLMATNVDSDAGLTLALVLGAAVSVALAMAMGVRYGYIQAAEELEETAVGAQGA